MGNRLYVAKTYKVEFAYGMGFNYMVSELHDLLDALNVSYSGESWDERFDVEKEEWLKGIEVLKNLDHLETSEREEIANALKACECTPEEAIELFEGYYNTADRITIIWNFNFCDLWNN